MAPRSGVCEFVLEGRLPPHENAPQDPEIDRSMDRRATTPVSPWVGHVRNRLPRLHYELSLWQGQPIASIFKRAF